MVGTRPVLGNDNANLKLNPQMDVQGFSHKSGGTFDGYHTLNPKKPTFASECCSCMTMREEGEYNGDCIAGQTNASNGRDYMSGTMVWTLFDYYGCVSFSTLLPRCGAIFCGCFVCASFGETGVYLALPPVYVCAHARLDASSCLSAGKATGGRT